MIYTFDSAMAGAPVDSGTAGALRAVIKACLVDGFGAGAVATLTVASGIATATFPGAHPYRIGTVSQFGGATPSGLNGQKRILTTTTNSVTFDATGIADGTATGTITHKVAAAGWQELFAGTLTNVLCVTPTVPEATGCVLRVDDTSTTNARVRAYEAMSDAATGVGQTPLESQLAGGLFWPKSNTANSTARGWYLVADERGFYLALAPLPAGQHTVLYFGDIASFKSGDAFGCLVTGNLSDQTGAASAPDGCVGYSSRGSTRSGAFMARLHTGIGQSVAALRTGAHHNGPTTDVYSGLAGYGFGAYPNGPNNGLMTAPLELFASGIRGSLPGLLHAVQDCGSNCANGAIIDGTDDLAGRKLMAIRASPPNNSGGTVFIDITGPWAR